MKLRLVLCALLLVVVSTPLVLADSTATALVRPDPIVVKTNVSRTFTVDIFVQDVANLYGADITFAFDPLQLEVVDAVPGVAGLQLAALDEFLYPDYVAKNKACNAVDQSDPDCAVAGLARYAALQINPRSPVSGSGALARITFRGLKPGSSSITVVTKDLSDRNGEPIGAVAQNGDVFVSTTTATETPAPTPTSSATPRPAGRRLYLPLVLR